MELRRRRQEPVPERGHADAQRAGDEPGAAVFLANGYYDLATPYLAAEWTFDHLHVDPELRDNLVTRRYESGHMMYLHEPSLAAVRADITEFMAASVPS